MMRYLVFYAVDMLLWSVVLILVLVLVSRSRGHRPTKAQAVWKLLLALYLAAVYNVAGAPELPYIYPRLNINLIPLWDITSGVRAYLINSGLNILLFIPLGFILPLTLAGKWVRAVRLLPMIVLCALSVARVAIREPERQRRPHDQRPLPPERGPRPLPMHADTPEERQRVKRRYRRAS